MLKSVGIINLQFLFDTYTIVDLQFWKVAHKSGTIIISLPYIFIPVYKSYLNLPVCLLMNHILRNRGKICKRGEMYFTQTHNKLEYSV